MENSKPFNKLIFQENYPRQIVELDIALLHLVIRIKKRKVNKKLHCDISNNIDVNYCCWEQQGT